MKNETYPFHVKIYISLFASCGGQTGYSSLNILLKLSTPLFFMNTSFSIENVKMRSGGGGGGAL